MGYLIYLWNRYILRDWWEVYRCGWPYEPGYATYNEGKLTALDTGLSSRDVAQHLCNELNSGLKKIWGMQ